MSDTDWGLPDPVAHAEFYADVPAKRLAAFVIDSVLIVLITLMIVVFTAFIGLFFLGFLALVVSMIYRTVSLANSSATPGMRVMSIEFRNRQGERFDLGTAFVHTLFYNISMSMVLPQIVSIVLMLTTPRAQSLSDLVLGTAAINRSAAH